MIQSSCISTASWSTDCLSVHNLCATCALTQMGWCFFNACRRCKIDKMAAAQMHPASSLSQNVQELYVVSWYSEWLWCWHGHSIKTHKVWPLHCASVNVLVNETARVQSQPTLNTLQFHKLDMRIHWPAWLQPLSLELPVLQSGLQSCTTHCMLLLWRVVYDSWPVPFVCWQM